MTLLTKGQNERNRDWIKRNLTARGYITRNECLQNYVSRLASDINVLKKQGYNIVGKEKDNGDYIYFLIGQGQIT